jgi:thiamine transporter
MEKIMNDGLTRKTFSPRILTISAALVALGTVAQYIKVLRMPMGGSITLFSMLFIATIGWLFGPVTGAIGGLTYGLIQLISELYVIHPVQFLLDYIFAFVALGAISGLFKNLNSGYLFAVLARFVCHVISGYVFFSEYMPEDFFMIPYMSGATLEWAYSVLYNAAYIIPEAAITVIILTVPAMRKALANLKKMATA